MADLSIRKVSECTIRIEAEKSILQELSERFTFDVPNAKFSPAYRNRMWDGKIRLLNLRTATIHAGLAQQIADYAHENEYTFDDPDGVCATVEFSLAEAAEFVKTLNLPFEVRDYQLRAFALAIRHRRAVLLSPTSSGKSLIAYLIARYYGVKTLIVVPTVSLVSQMMKDFESYGYGKEMHGVRAGKVKTTDLDITVSTWQSIYEQPESFFRDFGLVIGDEAHLFKAKSLTKVMSNMKHTEYRIGMTGTLDGAQVHELVLIGLFGPIHTTINTKTLISEGHAADLKIKILILRHAKEVCKQLAGSTYAEEIDHIVSSNARNRFIRNLALSLKGNTLILCAYVDKHLEVLYKDISAKKTSGVYKVSGSVDADEREEIRAIMEKNDDVIAIASYGVFSTGINIKRLHNIIFASPSKSRIRVMQSIGRGLRKGSDKSECNLFDISDDLTHLKKRNYTLNHLIERIKMYSQENFPYQIHTIEIKETNNDAANSLF